MQTFLNFHDEKAKVMTGVGQPPIVTHIRILTGHSISVIDEKRMFTPYVAGYMGKWHGIALHLTDVLSVKGMQSGTVPLSKTSHFGHQPYDKTHLMLARVVPDVIRNSACVVSGQAEVIPDEFREEDNSAS